MISCARTRYSANWAISGPSRRLRVSSLSLPQSVAHDHCPANRQVNSSAIAATNGRGSPSASASKIACRSRRFSSAPIAVDPSRQGPAPYTPCPLAPFPDRLTLLLERAGPLLGVLGGHHGA